MNANNEFQWRNELRKLAGPAQPSRDLWPDIQSRLAAEPRRRARWPLLAAAAVLLVALGAGVLAWRMHAPAPPQLDASARTALDWSQPNNPTLAAAAQDLDGASAQLQQALEQRPDAVFLVGLLNRTNSQRMRLMQGPNAG
jgi:hypothetical protein